MSKPKPKQPAQANGQEREQIICNRCRHAMQVAARIESFGEEPGLIAYECPACGAMRSFLVPRQERTGKRSRTGG